MADLRSSGTDTLAEANAGSKRAIAKLLHLRDLPTLARLGKIHYSG
jgi:hypothetical protein